MALAKSRLKVGFMVGLGRANAMTVHSTKIIFTVLVSISKKSAKILIVVETQYSESKVNYLCEYK